MKNSLQPLISKSPMFLLGLGASAASLIYFFWNTQTKRSEYQLEIIKRNVERAYQLCQSLCPLQIEREVIRHEDGLVVILKVIKTLAHKPTCQGQQKKNPFVRPFEKGMFVQKIGDTHFLLLNKFPVNAHHVIVVTKEPVPQSNPNTVQDLYQSYRVMKALQGFAYFNSSPEGGSSQPHKHLQILPHSAYFQSDVLKIIDDFLKKEREQDQLKSYYRLKHFKNIKHFIRPLQQLDEEMLQSHLYEQYLNLLKDISNKQFLTNDSIVSIKYNLIFTMNFMMIVERKKEKFNDSIAINAVGFTGSILIKTQKQLEELEQVKLVRILEEVSESASENEIIKDHKEQTWSWI